MALFTSCGAAVFLAIGGLTAPSLAPSGPQRYTTPEVLILDEIGYIPFDMQGGNLLYTLISRRHERRSTVLTTNLAYQDWSTIFPGAACLGALIDRFAQHCHTMKIEGPSWRNREHALKEADAKAKAKKSAAR